MLRLKHPTTGADTGRGLALTCDGNHRWCALDPRRGTALVVAEAVANLACVGARPLALVNCLNFGNPEHPETMWQLSEAVDGMAEACRALGAAGGRRQRQPLQREPGPRHRPHAGRGAWWAWSTSWPPRRPGRAWSTAPSWSCWAPSRDTLSGSRWAWRRGHQVRRAARTRPGAPTGAVCELVRDLVADGLVLGVHDTADGGLGAGAGRDGRRPAGSGARGRAARRCRRPPLAVRRVAGPLRAGRRPGGRWARSSAAVAAAGDDAAVVGDAGGDRITVEGMLDVALADAAAAWKGRLPELLGHGTTQG